MHTNPIMIVAAILLLSVGAIPQERSYESIKFGDFTIDPGKTVSVKFKQNDNDTRQIRLVFEARLDWKDLGGYTNGFVVAINGTAIHGSRLLNKPLNYKVRIGGGNQWCGLEDGSWFLMYSPDFSDAIKTDRNFIYGLFEKEQEPYRFVLDLTGLTQHVGENTVTFSHYMKAVLRNVHVEFDSQRQKRINTAKPKDDKAPTGPLSDCRPQGQLPSPVSLSAAKDGTLQIVALGRRFALHTRLGIPDGKFLNVTYSNATSYSYNTPEYAFSRTISVSDGKIQFTDTYRNLKQEVVGVIFDNVLSLPEAPSKSLFHGMEIMLEEIGSSTNPTLFALIGDDCAAIVLEDDISRNQAYLSKPADRNEIGYGDRSLGLPPNGSHTLVWSIYLLPQCDYYRFINRVRDDWNSNFTIDGPFSFPYGAGSGDTPVFYWDANAPVTEKAVRDYLSRRPVKHIITHVTGDYSVNDATSDHPRLGHGSSLMTPHYKWWQDSTRNMVSALKTYAPDVNVYAYLHKNLCSKIRGDTEFTDSLATDYTSVELSRKEGCRRYIPTTTNQYGKELKKTYRYLVDDIGANIYMDEICLGVTTWQSFPEWDGCTVAIDETTHKVKGKLTIPTLLVRPFLDEMCDYLSSKGRRLIANGAPSYRSLQSYKALHFTEEGMGVGGLYGMHLSTPLAFCYKNGEKGFEHFLSSMSCGLPCFIHSGDWCGHVFPMTPVELHAGYIICKERIITTVSGVFGWNDDSNAVCFVYDRKGNPVPSELFARRIEKDGHAACEIRMPDGYLAILVKNDQPDASVKAPDPQKVLKNVGPYKDWIILEADMRGDSASHVVRGEDFLELAADSRPFMFFTLSTLAVKSGQKVRIEMNVSGKGKVGAGILVYEGDGWKHLESSVKTKELDGGPMAYSEVFEFLNSKAGSVRLCLSIDKNSRARFGAMKATVMEAQ